ncbi:hypothetical protein I5535_19860 [Rhodobacteraceae bacterium F11138]|nr:hypothetical protein [Rhodobacteraceae bacterium F11138]
MILTNLIDLIAEVAAKRVAEKGAAKEDTPDAVISICRTIRADLWSRRHIFILISVFVRRLDKSTRTHNLVCVA